MKKKVYMGLLSLMLVVGILLAGCSSQTTAQSSSTTPVASTQTSTSVVSSTVPAPDAILVGAEIGETGFDAATGTLAKQGYDMAVNDINKDGGVFVQEYGKKIPLKLVYVDTESNPDKAVAAAEALYSQYHVSVAVGTTMVSQTPTTFEKNKLPIVASLETVNAIADQGFQYFFHIGALDSDKAQAVLDVFNNLPQSERPTKYAIFEEQLAFVSEFMGFIRQDAAKMGLDIVYSGQYATNAPDLTSLIKGAQNAGAQVVLSCPNAGDAITMLKQMSQLNYHPQGIVMVRGADDPSWPKLGAMGNYIVGSPDWHIGLNNPGTQQFVDEYKAQYGSDPQPDVGIAYASIQVVAAAIQNAGSLDSTKIRDALSALDASTIEGQVKFDSNGQMLNPPPVVVQWQNGTEQLVWPEASKTASLVYPIP